MDKQQGICYVSCTEGGYEVLQNLVVSDIQIDQIVSLTPDQGNRYNVAGYQPFNKIAEEHDIPIYNPEEYEMTTEKDVEFFRSSSFDLMIVNGWQRLIRDAVLDTLSIGAFGVHGSSSGLPKGRGRSPMNWSIIEDLDSFLLSVLKLDEGVDSGTIVGTQKFDITDYDTIRTMYYKLAMATTDILLDSLPSILDGTIEYTDQTGEPTYYPKRTPEDGGVHWHNSTRHIYNLVRAVAAPYPGAFTEYDGERVCIWEAIPFSTDFGHGAEEGEIIQVFDTTDEFVVRTGDGTLLVQQWEGAQFTPTEGIVFNSIGPCGRADEDKDE